MCIYTVYGIPIVRVNHRLNFHVLYRINICVLHLENSRAIHNDMATIESMYYTYNWSLLYSFTNTLFFVIYTFFTILPFLYFDILISFSRYKHRERSYFVIYGCKYTSTY